MKKLIASMALCAFAATLFAAAPAAPAAKEKVLRKGPFEVVVTRKAPRGVTGKEWIKGWGLAGSATVEKSVLKLKSGVIYGFTISSKAPMKYTFTFKASALPNSKNAFLDGYTSTCVRKPGDKKPFRHEKRVKFGPFKLTAAEKEYKVEYNVAAFEQGYLYVGGKDIALSSIRIVAVPAK